MNVEQPLDRYHKWVICLEIINWWGIGLLIINYIEKWIRCPEQTIIIELKQPLLPPSSNTYRGHSLTGPSTLGVREFMKNDLKWISIEYHAHVTHWHGRRDLPIVINDSIVRICPGRSSRSRSSRSSARIRSVDIRRSWSEDEAMGLKLASIGN